MIEESGKQWLDITDKIWHIRSDLIHGYERRAMFNLGNLFSLCVEKYEKCKELQKQEAL